MSQGSASGPRVELDKLLAELRDNPELLDRALASVPAPQHDCEPAESLLLFQNRRVSRQAARAESRLERLLEQLRCHDEMNRRLHRLGLELLRSGDLDERLEVLARLLQEDAWADVATLRIYARPKTVLPLGLAEFVEPLAGELEIAQACFCARRALYSKLEPSIAASLFPESVSRLHSWLLVPLGEIDLQGMLVFGGREPEYFRARQSNRFFDRLGGLVTAALGPYLARAPESHG